jgi:hypothetical protein
MRYILIVSLLLALIITCNTEESCPTVVGYMKIQDPITGTITGFYLELSDGTKVLTPLNDALDKKFGERYCK